MSKSDGKKNPLKTLLAGGVAGGVEVAIMYPTEFVKTQLQLAERAAASGVGGRPEFKGPLDCARRIAREKGVFALYRGLSTLLVGSIPKAAVRFAAFEQLSKLFKQPDGKLSTSASMVCGLGAGASEAIIAVTPMESIKTKMIHDQNSANPRYRGLGHAVKTIVREEGIAGIYRGLVPTVVKQSGNQMVRFSVFRKVKDFMQGGDPNKTLSFLQNISAGMVAGFVSVYATMPFDVVKTSKMLLLSRSFTMNCLLTCPRF